MQKHFLRWVPIVVLLLMATLVFTLHITRATTAPCRPNLEMCQPETQLPPCQLSICPNADMK